MSLSVSRKTRKVNPSLKLKLNKSLKTANKLGNRWTEKIQFEDNALLKNILKEAHQGLKEYNTDLLEAYNIVNRLENNDDLTENDVEDALLELELINASIQSYYSKNANLKKKLQTMKTKGGKAKKYAYRKTRKVRRKRNNKKKNI